MKVFGILAAFLAISSCTRESDSRIAIRAPAGTGCPSCDELTQLRTNLDRVPSSFQEKRGSKKRASLEAKELEIVRKGGIEIVSLFVERSPNSAEVRAAAEFLVKTAERDKGGVAVDWIYSTLGSAAPAAMKEIQGSVADLVQEKAVTDPQVKAFQQRVEVLQSEIKRGQG